MSNSRPLPMPWARLLVAVLVFLLVIWAMFFFPTPEGTGVIP
ncbi:hypothetical protein [Haloarchaeobius baliensis]